MQYQCPYYNDLGGIGAPMNPFFEPAINYGPTRLIADPRAGQMNLPRYGLDGRHFDRNFFDPHQGGQLYGWRDALDVFTAASFLFPE